MGYEDWHVKLFEQELGERAGGNLQPYTIREASGKQELAIRSFAFEQGFTDLRGFHMWMKSMDIDYYDIIKIASP